VADEDTIASVARTYHVTETELATANQLRASDNIQGIESLLVPAPPIAEPSAHTRLYTVRKGDTLVTIADRFGVSLNELRQWNRIPGIKVQPGQRLRLAEPANASRSSAHRRQRSETQADPAKNASEVLPADGMKVKKSASASKRSAPAASAEKSTTTSAKKSRAQKRSTKSKAKTTK
jgi:membrane-bound lytic murein transglycosylase D